jgi:hypothetical protein
MTPTAQRHQQVLLASEADRMPHIRNPTAARHQRRAPIDVAIPDPPGLLVTGIAGADQVSPEHFAQSCQVFHISPSWSIQPSVLPQQCPVVVSGWAAAKAPAGPKRHAASNVDKGQALAVIGPKPSREEAQRGSCRVVASPSPATLLRAIHDSVSAVVASPLPSRSSSDFICVVIGPHRLVRPCSALA